MIWVLGGYFLGAFVTAFVIGLFNGTPRGEHAVGDMVFFAALWPLVLPVYGLIGFAKLGGHLRERRTARVLATAQARQEQERLLRDAGVWLDEQFATFHQNDRS